MTVLNGVFFFFVPFDQYFMSSIKAFHATRIDNIGVSRNSYWNILVKHQPRFLNEDIKICSKQLISLHILHFSYRIHFPINSGTVSFSWEENGKKRIFILLFSLFVRLFINLGISFRFKTPQYCDKISVSVSLYFYHLKIPQDCDSINRIGVSEIRHPYGLRRCK